MESDLRRNCEIEIEKRTHESEIKTKKTTTRNVPTIPMYIHNFFHVPPRKVTIEFFLHVFTEFTKLSDKNICNYNKRAWTCHPATSCVRDQDATTAPATHMWETGYLKWQQFTLWMLWWFIRFPEFAEFPFHLEKTPFHRTLNILEWWTSSVQMFVYFLNNIEVYEEQVQPPNVIPHPSSEEKKITYENSYWLKPGTVTKKRQSMQVRKKSWLWIPGRMLSEV